MTAYRGLKIEPSDCFAVRRDTHIWTPCGSASRFAKNLEKGSSEQRGAHDSDEKPAAARNSSATHALPAGASGRGPRGTHIASGSSGSGGLGDSAMTPLSSVHRRVGGQKGLIHSIHPETVLLKLAQKHTLASLGKNTSFNAVLVLALAQQMPGCVMNLHLRAPSISQCVDVLDEGVASSRIGWPRASGARAAPGGCADFRVAMDVGEGDDGFSHGRAPPEGGIRTSGRERVPHTNAEEPKSSLRAHLAFHFALSLR